LECAHLNQQIRRAWKRKTIEGGKLILGAARLNTRLTGPRKLRMLIGRMEKIWRCLAGSNLINKDGELE